jgi:hypothetical protein
MIAGRGEMGNEKGPLLRGRRHAGVLAAFVVLTAIATWPMAAHLGTHVPGDPTDPGDYWAYYWDLWWVKSALLQGQSPLHTSLLHHPDGADLSFHSLLLAPAALVSPVTATLGATVSYNLLVWLSFVGSAIGVYLVVLELRPENRSRLAAFLAGVAYAFAAYRFRRMMGHLDLLSTEWLPFAALFLVRGLRDGGRGNAFALAVFTVLTCLTNWYLGVALVLFALVAAGDMLLGAGGSGAWTVVRRVAVPLALAAALTCPVWAGMVRQGGEGGRLDDPLGDSIANSADVVGFLLPSSAHPLWGGQVAALRARLFGASDNDVENTVFFGFVPLALGILGWREARSPPARFFRTGWIVFTLLALGPYLQVAGHTVRIAGHRLSGAGRAGLAAHRSPMRRRRHQHGAGGGCGSVSRAHRPDCDRPQPSGEVTHRAWAALLDWRPMLAAQRLGMGGRS